MFNFQYGKTQRDGADHILTVPYDEEYVAVCPVRSVTQLMDIGKGVGWDMTGGYLLSEISCARDGKVIRDSLPISAAKMSAALKKYMHKPRERRRNSLCTLSDREEHLHGLSQVTLSQPSCRGRTGRNR